MDLKQRLRDRDDTLSMLGCLVPSAVTAQVVARSGIDIVMFDLEHMPLDAATLHAMIAATQGTACAPLVRVPGHDPAPVKLALDLGAEGIVFPLVRTEREAAACVAATRYPPRGIRGWGPFAAHARWGVAAAEYLPRLGDRIVTCLLIETAEAVENIAGICAVDGVDFLFVAPFDLSTSLGVPGDFEAPAFRAAVARVEAAAHAAGVPLGGGPVTGPDAARDLATRGYRVLADFDLFQLGRTAGALAGWTKDAAGTASGAPAG